MRQQWKFVVNGEHNYPGKAKQYRDDRNQPIRGRFETCTEPLCSGAIEYDQHGFWVCSDCGVILSRASGPDPADNVDISQDYDPGFDSIEEWVNGNDTGFQQDYTEEANTKTSFAKLSALEAALRDKIAAWREAMGLTPEDPRLDSKDAMESKGARKKSRKQAPNEIYSELKATIKTARIRALGYILAYPGTNASELGRVLGISHTEADRTLRDLAEHGDVYAIKEGRSKNAKVGWYPTKRWATNIPPESAPIVKTIYH
jgi:hypothetical protein